MNLEERIKFIYDVLRPVERLSHNELWRQVQTHFKLKKSDGFAKDTFERTLHEMEDRNLIYKRKDETSKLGKMWYYASLDHSELEEIVPDNIDTFLNNYVEEYLMKFRERFSTLDNHQKAIGLSNFFMLVLPYEALTEKYVQMFPKNKQLANILQRWHDIRNILYRLVPVNNKSDTKEVNQLVISELNRHANSAWSKIVSFEVMK